MPKFTIDKNGVATFEDKVPTQIDYECSCGSKATITVELPENVTFNSEITFSQLKCSECGQGVKLPRSSYTVKDGKLVDLNTSEAQ
ncbi:hypothetical protein QPB17_002810 [Vibrio cholerae]|uniref:hypothetical protein n=1 Tax=Vibrio cholerae TaxID=666 RepID=UPI002933C063|nr:hypothetical protein [Vibrio cholerae]ELT8461241.1 hypothetical protein [Vibrio cholerae]